MKHRIRNKMSRLLSLFLAILTVVPILSVPAGAANVPSVSSNSYYSCYTLASSGKVYAYTDASLSKRTGGYIACSTDECRIIAISGGAVQISYPVGNNNRRIAWFARSEFTIFDLTSGNIQCVKATSKMTTYKRSSGSSTYGSVSQGDVCYVLGTTGTRTQLVYPVANSKYKLAWVNTSDANKYLSGGTTPTPAPDTGSTIAYVKTSSTSSRLNMRSGPGSNYSVVAQLSYGTQVQVLGTSGSWKKISVNGKTGYVSAAYLSGTNPYNNPQPTSDTWIYPMDNAYVCGNDWGTYYSKRPDRPYHCGIDIASRTGSTDVKAAANGTIVRSGWNSANGYYVVIQHTLSGKTVYSFYAHLSSISRSSGYVAQGTKIGVMGNTGSSSSGAHLHFAVVDTLKSGSYYGYTANTGSNKTTYGGTTYYNPHYIVNNDKLPG